MIPPNTQLHGLKWGHTNSRTFSEASLRLLYLSSSSHAPGDSICWNCLPRIPAEIRDWCTWQEGVMAATPGTHTSITPRHCLFFEAIHLLQKQFSPLLKLPNPSLSPKKNRCKLRHLTELLGTCVVPSACALCAFSLVNLSAAIIRFKHWTRWENRMLFCANTYSFMCFLNFFAT